MPRLQGVVVFRLPLLAGDFPGNDGDRSRGLDSRSSGFSRRSRARQAPHLAPMIATIGVAITLTSVIEGTLRRRESALSGGAVAD